MLSTPPRCVASKDCNSYNCQNGFCKEKSLPFEPCSPYIPGICPLDYECSSLSWRCVRSGYETRSPCIRDGDCHFDRYCHAGSCLLRRLQNGPCLGNYQCKDGYLCIEQRCLQRCLLVDGYDSCPLGSSCEADDLLSFCQPILDHSKELEDSTFGGPDSGEILLGVVTLIATVSIFIFFYKTIKLQLEYRRKRRNAIVEGLEARRGDGGDFPPPYTISPRPVMARLASSYLPDLLLPSYQPPVADGGDCGNGNNGLSGELSPTTATALVSTRELVTEVEGDLGSPAK